MNSGLEVEIPTTLQGHACLPPEDVGCIYLVSRAQRPLRTNPIQSGQYRIAKQ